MIVRYVLELLTANEKSFGVERPITGSRNQIKETGF